MRRSLLIHTWMVAILFLAMTVAPQVQAAEKPADGTTKVSTKHTKSKRHGLGLRKSKKSASSTTTATT